MGRIGPNYAASDGGGIGVLSVILIIAAVAALCVAIKKYRLGQTDPAYALGAVAGVMIMMALGVLSN